MDYDLLLIKGGISNWDMGCTAFKRQWIWVGGVGFGLFSLRYHIDTRSMIPWVWPLFSYRHSYPSRPGGRVIETGGRAVVI
jgi:hypothetical protein